MKILIISILALFISCMPEEYKCNNNCDNKGAYIRNNQQSYYNGIRVPYQNYYGYAPVNNGSNYPQGTHLSPGRFNLPSGRFHNWSQPLNSNRFNIPAGRTHNWSRPGRWRM